MPNAARNARGSRAGLRRAGPQNNPRRSSAASLVADVGRAAALAGRPLAVAAAGRWAPIAALGKLEAQRAADRVRLGEPKRQPLADLVGLAGLLADELLGG